LIRRKRWLRQSQPTNTLAAKNWCGPCENQRIRSRVAFALSGCIALFALAALFLAGDREAATILAMMTCVAFAVSSSAGKAGLKKAVDWLQEMDQSM
jgi:hypothetical protein